MNIINLSGIQSLDIPISVFDEFMSKSRHYGNAAHPEGTDVEVVVRHVPEKDDEEMALACVLDNVTIGWLPKITTIDGYIQKARRDNDLKKWQWHSDRKVAAEFIRTCVERDMLQHLPVRGVLRRVQIAEDSGKLLSVSVGFDYM